MRYLVLVLSLFLTACHKPAETPAAPAAATAPASTDDGWNGKYEGDLRVEVTGTSGAHKVSLLVATADCTGDIGLSDGGVAASADDASALDVSLDTDGKGECEVTLRRDGNKLASSETVECAQFHGATCSFNGRATRVK